MNYKLKQLYNNTAIQRLDIDAQQLFYDHMTKQTSKCLNCKGVGETSQPTIASGVRKYVHCGECIAYANRLTEFCRIYGMIVPPSYRFAKLSQLKPFTGTVHLVSMADQRDILDMLRADPEKGYCFCGPAHCGKTVWLTALYTQNLWFHFMRDNHHTKLPVWRINAKRLCDQHTEYNSWKMNRYQTDIEVDEPFVTVDKIKALKDKGITYKLYLEEIDKVGTITDARRSTMFDILDTLMSHQGILVLNTNFHAGELERKFGDDFAWRIRSLCKIIDLYDSVPDSHQSEEL